MEISYNKVCDCLYIKFRHEKVSETDRDQKSGVIFDYSETGGIIGIEILSASSKVTDPAKVNLKLL